MKRFLLLLFLIGLFCSCEELSSPAAPTPPTPPPPPPPQANVIMLEGPLFENGSSFYFSYTGRIKNTGNATAKYTIVYIYVRKPDGSLLSTEWDYADDTDLSPGETSYFETLFWDDDYAIRNKMDKSKTTYEIKWD